MTEYNFWFKCVSVKNKVIATGLITVETNDLTKASETINKIMKTKGKTIDAEECDLIQNAYRIFG